jgi:hypothetical protein
MRTEEWTLKKPTDDREENKYRNYDAAFGTQALILHPRN